MIEISGILQAERHLDEIELVIFDMDDTLYAEKSYVKSGYKRIAEVFTDVQDAEQKLWRAFLAGEKAIDYVLEKEGMLTEDNRRAWLDVYRNQQPEIELYPGVKQMLARIAASGKKLGLITDGRPEGQRAKIKALGIEDCFDKIIVTDELGGTQFRKPNPIAFQQMLNLTGISADKAAYIGDNPNKDFVAPEALGMRCIYYKNQDGLYSGTKENAMNTTDKYNTRETHEALLPMMRDFHEFCAKNEVKYSLAYGSLLGAVRHKGFIPWDDDLDVFMDRQNAEKFYSVMHEMDGYSVSRELWTWRVRKEGLSSEDYVPTLDVFVIDNVPDGKLARKAKILKLRLLQGMLHEKPDFSSGRYGFAQKVLLTSTYLLGRLFTKKWLWKRYDAVSKKHSEKKTELQACFNASYKCLTMFFKSGLMDELVLAPFEDAEFYIMRDYDDNLRSNYGDYMTPPSEEDRIPQHVSTRGSEQ